MRKLLLLIICCLAFVGSYAQQGVLTPRYYISGSLSVGKGDRSYVEDTANAWMEIGNANSNKGIYLPQGFVRLMTSTGKGLFVYDKDSSVLFHLDNGVKVRYMTYKDTNFLKQFINAAIPVPDTNVLATKYFVRIYTNSAISDSLEIVRQELETRLDQFQIDYLNALADTSDSIRYDIPDTTSLSDRINAANAELNDISNDMALLNNALANLELEALQLSKEVDSLFADSLWKTQFRDTVRPGQEVVYVFLSLGQSNKSGQAQFQRLANTQYNYIGIGTSYPAARTSQPQYVANPSGVYTYFKTKNQADNQTLDNGSWQPYVAGSNSNPDDPNSRGFFGSELSLATNLRNATGKNIYIIKAAFAGTSLSPSVASQPPGNWTNFSDSIAMKYYFQRAIRDLRTSKPNAKIVLTHIGIGLGEQDASAGVSSANYTTYFNQLKTYVDSVVRSEGFSNYKWLIQQIDLDRTAGEDTINKALQNIVSACSNCYFITHKDLPRKQDLTSSEAAPLTKGSPNASGANDDAHKSYIAQQGIGEREYNIIKGDTLHSYTVLPDGYSVIHPYDSSIYRWFANFNKFVRLEPTVIIPSIPIINKDSFWNINGNTVTTAPKFGTNNNQVFTFIQNGSEVGRYNGSWLFGGTSNTELWYAKFFGVVGSNNSFAANRSGSPGQFVAMQDGNILARFFGESTAVGAKSSGASIRLSNANTIVARFYDDGTLPVTRTITEIAAFVNPITGSSVSCSNCAIPGQYKLYDGSRQLNVAYLKDSTSSAASMNVIPNISHYYFTGTTATWTLHPATGNREIVHYIRNGGSGDLNIVTTSAVNELVVSTTSALTNTYTIPSGSARIITCNGVYLWVQ